MADLLPHKTARDLLQASNRAQRPPPQPPNSATMSTPSIACIGIIGKHDNPLHISLFPPYTHRTAPPSPKTTLEFSHLLNASLDLFDARSRDRSSMTQDLGLLQPIDERLSLWGWLTGTGVKFAIIVDSWGKEGVAGGVKGMLDRSDTGGEERERKGKKGGGVGQGQVQDADLRVAFKALQTAYVKLLQNPFYVPDEHVPMAVAQGRGRGGEIKSQRFVEEVRRIGGAWRPGLSVV